jgi:hypothetical protein
MSELTDWMRKHNIAQKLRMLIEQMENGQIYGPLEEMMHTGFATVQIEYGDVVLNWKPVKKTRKKKRNRKGGTKKRTKDGK